MASSAGSGSYGGSASGKGGYSGSSKGSYGFAGGGSYGKGDLTSGYLTNYSKGIGTGYINNRLDSYLNKSNSYKNSQLGKGYELRDVKSVLQSLFRKDNFYDVEILRKPMIDLEERLKKYKRKCPHCGSGAGTYSMN
jgi:hypothetical protein